MRLRPIFVLVLCALSTLCAVAQNKLLTIDDIFDPAKRVNFNGSAPGNLQWLKNGEFYLQAKNDPATKTSQLMKVNAVSGQMEPFFDAAKMEATLAKLPGMTAENARSLAHRPTYQLNPAENAVLINHANDLYYYQLGADAAVRLTNNADEESEQDFSPDGKMVA